MDIGVSKHTLANGLQILIHEAHDCPIVALNIWYHVGSKNERPGRTGFAHLFEHLMFEGSEHHDRGYFHPLQEAGAVINGSTNADRTNYWEVVPTNALELAFWMESDRMGYLLPALTAEKFENQRSVVLNERRQNYENRPYGMAPIALSAALYDETHPYRWPTIGAPEDLSAATLDEVRGFFDTYYHPANASLAVAGDIDTDSALRLAERYFAEIEPGPPVGRLTRSAELEREIRLVLEDRVELARLYLAWHTPPLFGAGDADLDLAADLLAGGKTSRLYRSLVYERRLATDVSAVQGSREMSGVFQIVATATPDRGLGEIEEAIREEVDRLISDGPGQDELHRSQVLAEAQFVYRLQSVGGFGGKSDQLNSYNVFLGNPWFFQQDLARYHQVTRESLQAAIGRHLRAGRRATLSVVPRGRNDLAVAGSCGIVVS